MSTPRELFLATLFSITVGVLLFPAEQACGQSEVFSDFDSTAGGDLDYFSRIIASIGYLDRPNGAFNFDQSSPASSVFPVTTASDAGAYYLAPSVTPVTLSGRGFLTFGGPRTTTDQFFPFVGVNTLPTGRPLSVSDLTGMEVPVEGLRLNLNAGDTLFLYYRVSPGVTDIESLTLGDLFRSLGLLTWTLGDPRARMQVTQSALPMNQTLGTIAPDLANLGTRDFSNRLFRVRSRYVPPGGTTTSNSRFENRGRELAASRFRKMESRLTGNTMINLNGRRGEGHDRNTPNGTSTSAAPTLNDSSPFLSVERPAGASVAPGTIASGSNWTLFASADFGNVELDRLGPTNPGVESNTQVSNIGFEYAINDQISIGLGWSHLWNDNTLNGGLGSIDVEGDAAVVYATCFKDNFWGDLLYSFGNYESNVRRNTGLDTFVNGTPDIKSHQAAMNFGYNMGIDGGRIVHGPTFGASYTAGSVDAYIETGDLRSNTRFASQNFESLITRLGYQVNWEVESTIGTIRPQVRIGYGRENLNRDTAVAAALVPNLANNNTVFGIGTSTSVDPGEGWLELGKGVSIEICENAMLLVDYQGQFLRQDVREAHFGSVKVRLKF